MPFEDLSKADSDTSNNSQNYTSTSGLNHLTAKGTTTNKLKKRVGLFGIFASNKVRPCVCVFASDAIYFIFEFGLPEAFDII